MVKRTIPSVISVKGAAGGKTTAKVLRSDAGGNLHLLIPSGTSAQELRIITTVGDFLSGESLRRELNEMLSEAMDWWGWDGASGPQRRFIKAQCSWHCLEAFYAHNKFGSVLTFVT